MTCASVEDHMTQGSSRCTVTYHRASAGRETLPPRSGRGDVLRVRVWPNQETVKSGVGTKA